MRSGAEAHAVKYHLVNKCSLMEVRGSQAS